MQGSERGEKGVRGGGDDSLPHRRNEERAGRFSPDLRTEVNLAAELQVAQRSKRCRRQEEGGRQFLPSLSSPKCSTSEAN